MNPLELFYIRDLADKIRKMNVRMTWSFDSGGWFISLEDVMTGDRAVSSSHDILQALKDCMDKIKETRFEFCEHPTTRVTKVD